MTFGLLFFLYFCTVVISRFPGSGPGIIWSCDNFNGFPVSLSFATAGILTDIIFCFRPSTYIENTCLELGIPVMFDIPEDPGKYSLSKTDTMWRLQIDNFNLVMDDNVVLISDVLNPPSGNYGPFTVKTRACCFCQIEDETINFHFLNINEKPRKLDFSMRVMDQKAAYDVNPTIGDTVSLKFNIVSGIDVMEKLQVTVDSVWDATEAWGASQKIDESTYEFDDLERDSEFQVTLYGVKAPYYVPGPENSSTFDCTVRILSPPSEMRDENNYIVYLEAKNSFPITIHSGTIGDVQIKAANRMDLKFLATGMTLFLEVYFSVSHELGGEGNRITVEMSDSWTPLWNGDECFFDPYENAACAISQTNRRMLEIQVKRRTMARQVVYVRGLIEIQSTKDLRVVKITSYNKDNRKMDESTTEFAQSLQNHGVEMRLLLTDISGQEQHVTAGEQNVMLQFVIMPSSPEFFDKDIANTHNIRLFCSRDFHLLGGVTQTVLVKKHSSSFVPLDKDDIHIMEVTALVDTSSDSSWSLSFDVSRMYPLSYGMFSVLVRNVTLPAYASNLHLAYECRAEIGQVAAVSEVVYVRSSSAIAADVYYYCLGNVPGAPIGVYIEANGTVNIAGDDPGRIYYVELEFPVDGEYGFPYLLGSGLQSGGRYAHYSEVNSVVKTTEVTIEGDQERTLLRIQLPGNSDVHSVLLRFSVGAKKNTDHDTPVVVRTYSVLRSRQDVKQITYETVSILATKFSPRSPPAASELSADVLEVGKEGIMSVSLKTTGYVPKFIYVVFPMKSGLSSVATSLGAYMTLFPLSSGTDFASLLIRYNAQKSIPDPLKFNITRISFPPSPEMRINYTVAVCDRGDMARECRSVLMKTKLTEPVVAIESSCAPLFSMSSVRAGLRVTYRARNGLVANSTISGKFSQVWGTNFAQCEVVTPQENVFCTIDPETKVMNVTVSIEVRDALYVIDVQLTRLKIPANSVVSRDLFESVQVFVPVSSTSVSAVPQKASAPVKVCGQ